MTQQTTQIPVSSIILDEDIYPQKGIALAFPRTGLQNKWG
jgi:hypothetical protein